jgi:16S rRNA (guanine527-N7)-methyltransferase
MRIGGRGSPTSRSARLSNKAMNQEILLKGAANFGISLTPRQLVQFEEYLHELISANEKINLTSITEPDEIIIKHFLDSLSVAEACNLNISDLSVIDIGSGAGFPGIPLKIAFPQIKLTLLEATRKKAEFLKGLLKVLKLPDVSVVWGRAEDKAKEYCEQFDLTLSRAVSKLPALVELCLPYNKVNSIFIAQKGDDSEIAAALNAIKVLGGEVKAVKNLILPSSDIRRSLIVISKVSQTPPNYPRRAGIPGKRPL